MSLIPTSEQIEVAREKADDTVIDYTTSSVYFDAVESIAATHKLHIDETGNIGDALMAVFYGVVPVEQFPNLLKEALEQNSATHDAVLKDINEKIFVPFRKSLEEKPTTDPVAETTPPTQVGAPKNLLPTETRNEEKPILSSSVSRKEEHVSVDTLNEQHKEETQQKPTYGSTDPYREPIE